MVNVIAGGKVEGGGVIIGKIIITTEKNLIQPLCAGAVLLGPDIFVSRRVTSHVCRLVGISGSYVRVLKSCPTFLGKKNQSAAPRGGERENEKKLPLSCLYE